MNACQSGVSLDGSSLRRLTLLVGAMLMAVAMFGVGASSAAAEPVGIYLSGEESGEEANQPIFEAESYPLFIEGKPQSVHQYTFQAGSWQCPGMYFARDFFGEDEEVTGATKTLVFQPSFFPAECSTSPEKYKTEFRRNACAYVLDVLNSGPPYSGQWAIDCLGERGMEILVKLFNGVTICTVEILPQTGLQGVGLENAGTGSESVIEADFEISGIKYTQSGQCTPGEFEDGTYTGESELFGDDE